MHRHGISLVAIPVLTAALFSSCGARADLAFRADRSASLSLGIEVPQAVEAKLRQFAASGQAPVALFDAAAVSASVTARGLAVRDSAAPTGRSYRGTFVAGDLERLLATDRDLATVMNYARGPGWASIRLRVDRANARAIVRLFPGLDENLLESLQPPALYDNPVNAAEYRSMLAGLLGKTAAGALDALAFELTVSLPGTVLDSGGSARVDAGKRTASLSIPALDIMVLEDPVDFYVRWKE